MWEFKGIMLTAEELVRRRTKSDFILPTKGPKCFTPNGSWLESKQLQTLLDATKSMIAEERVERENALAQADWDENLKVAKVTRIVGRQFEKFGHEENMSIFLYPEEALYLLETNHLQLLYGGVSMSIQQAYTVLIGPKTGCSFVEYMVFSHLLKNGFKVLRHSAKRTVTRYERLIGLHQELPRNRKSRRKSGVQKETNSERNNKSIKMEQKIEVKDERNVLGIANIDFPIATGVLKCDKSLKKNKLRVIEGSVGMGSMECSEEIDNISSNGSEIEILSEKSVCHSEESLDYDITDNSSLVSDDSDCQVIEEINSGSELLMASAEKKVIEEIDLSSGGSEGGDPSHLKSEVYSEEMFCDDLKLKENNIHDEKNDSHSDLNRECHVNMNVIQVDSFTLETSGGSSVIEPDSSCLLLGPECVSQEVHTIDENNLPLISENGNEVETTAREKQDKIEEDTSIASDVKEEKVDCGPGTVLMNRESVIRRNIAVPLKMESKTVICEPVKKQTEIEIIVLDDDNCENSVIEDKKTILQSFPNTAGCHIIHCQVPPQRLCPPNVNPIQRMYSIVLERLQDPTCGGNPRRKNNFRNERPQDRFGRFQNPSRENSPHRFRSRPNRRFSRFINSSRDNERPDRWHSNEHGNECFANYPRFHEQITYPNFHSLHMDQSDQNSFAHFSGQPFPFSSIYQHPRINLRARGHANRGMRAQNSYRGHYFRNSPRRRYPRRKGHGTRNFSSERYFPACENENNESLDGDEDYVPFNVDNAERSGEQPRRSDTYNLREKRPRETSGESIDSSSTISKRPRRSTANYLPSSGNSDLLSFLDMINSDTTGTTGQNLERRVPENLNLRGLQMETESTDNARSSGSSSGSSECSSSDSEDSSEELADETYDNGSELRTISVLLKSDDLQDTDSCLKSLDIVRSMKFGGLAAESNEPLLTIKFDLYQPSTPFRRSEPPVPDFRVVVVQPDQYLPSSRQLAFLGEGFDDDVPLLFAVASIDSVAFYLQSVVNLPFVSSKEKIEG